MVLALNYFSKGEGFLTFYLTQTLWQHLLLMLILFALISTMCSRFNSSYYSMTCISLQLSMSDSSSLTCHSCHSASESYYPGFQRVECSHLISVITSSGLLNLAMIYVFPSSPAAS